MRRYDVEKLEDKRFLKDYNNTTKKIFEEKQIKHTSDVNEIWNNVKDFIETAATGVIGTKKNVSKVWFNNICEEAIRRRKAAREECLKDTDNETKRTRFTTRRKEADNILRYEKRKFVCNLLERVEQDFKANKTHDMYKTIKNLSGDFKRSERFNRDSNGFLVTTDEGIGKE